MIFRNWGATPNWHNLESAQFFSLQITPPYCLPLTPILEPGVGGHGHASTYSTVHITVGSIVFLQYYSQCADEGMYSFRNFMKMSMTESRAHRRMMERETKAKVVASVWGTEIIQFLATLSILYGTIWKNRMN